MNQAETELQTVSSLFSVAGKTVIVTGGSRGIGKMIASALVKAGAKVYISSRSEANCIETVAELSDEGCCFAIPADLSTMEGCEELRKEFGKYEDHLDVLVNNAGAAWRAPVEEYPRVAWDNVLDLNVKGVFFVTQLMLPFLRASAAQAPPARVINIGSAYGMRVPIFDNFAYSASKAAVHHLTRHLASTLAPSITVNAIAPGFFATDMMEHALTHRLDDVLNATPLGRVGNADEIAGAVIYLASRPGAWVTGTVLSVDGGMASKW
jgi:NAD(P)-dependent dehydrogenase (short-subunit alcohol dehydrogenase family)